MHSEDANHANPPDFLASANLTAETKAYRSYVGFRRVLISFATVMHDAGVAWDFQPDWNFTLGVLKYEVDSYTAPSASDLPTV